MTNFLKERKKSLKPICFALLLGGCIGKSIERPFFDLTAIVSGASDPQGNDFVTSGYLKPVNPEYGEYLLYSSREYYLSQNIYSAIKVNTQKISEDCESRYVFIVGRLINKRGEQKTIKPISMEMSKNIPGIWNNQSLSYEDRLKTDDVFECLPKEK